MALPRQRGTQPYVRLGATDFEHTLPTQTSSCLHPSSVSLQPKDNAWNEVTYGKGQR